MKSLTMIVLCVALCCGIASGQEPRQKPKELETLGQYVGYWTSDVTSKRAEWTPSEIKYGASLMQIQTAAVNIFSATVYEFSEKDLQGFDPKELLARHLTSGDEVELTRKEIEHGPNKHLGLELTSKDDGGFYRRVSVMVGRRIYSVKFTSAKQEGLTADDVLKFFESFAIKE